MADKKLIERLRGYPPYARSGDDSLAAQRIEELSEELDRLKSKLPMTADGVVILPGMTLYDYDRYDILERLVLMEAWELDEDGEPDCAFGHMTDCYSTRKAAEQAQSKD